MILLCLSVSAVSATDLSDNQINGTSSFAEVHNINSRVSPHNTYFLNELQEKIDNAPAGSVLDIYDDYDDYSCSGLSINKDLTIDGHGHTIDCLSKNRDSVIHSTQGNIVLMNLNIINAHNDESYKGGAIFIEGSAKYVIDNCTFHNNWADDYGAAIYNDVEKTLTIRNSYFKSNIVDDDNGGAVFSKGDVIIENSDFDYNVADNYGGAVYCEKNVDVSNSVFRFNRAENDDGGAIFSKGKVTIKRSSFIENFADDYGGAVFADNININVQEDIGDFNTYFTRNTASDDKGGALYSQHDIKMVNVVYNSNTALVDGGAVCAGGNVTVKHCLFDANKADGASSQCYGGAIRGNGVTVDNSTFTNNHARDYGGAIYANSLNINSITPTLKSIFINNYVNDDKGGAVYCDGTVNVNCALFDSNKAKVDGGAIYSVDNVHVKNSVFEKNEAKGFVSRCFGGAIRAEDDVSIDDSSFSGNIAENHGGAVYATNVKLLNKNYFIGNTATKGQGGAIWAERFTDPVKYAIFSNNKAGIEGSTDDGGAIYINSKGDYTFLECIFSNNHCSDEGGAIYVDSSGSSLTLTNNIFVGNVADDEGQDVFNCGSYASIKSNFWSGLNPGTDNDKLVEWKTLTSNVHQGDSNAVIPIMIVTVGSSVDNKPIIKVMQFFYTSNGNMVNSEIFDLNQIEISSSQDAVVTQKVISDNMLEVELTPLNYGTYTITSDFYGYKSTGTVIINSSDI